MRYYNILEPRFICDKAIKILKREKNKLDSESKKYIWSENRTLENDIANFERNLIIQDYNKLISDLETLGEFGVQQMEKISKNNEEDNELIY